MPIILPRVTCKVQGYAFNDKYFIEMEIIYFYAMVRIYVFFLQYYLGGSRYITTVDRERRDWRDFYLDEMKCREFNIM